MIAERLAKDVKCPLTQKRCMELSNCICRFTENHMYESRNITIAFCKHFDIQIGEVY